jgi:histidinol-phosphate phosphatase family protein
MAKGVFLDRDETLNPDPGYISDATQFSLYPWVIADLKRLKDAGFKLIIVSNQSGIGRGLVTWDQLKTIHEKLARELKAAANIEIDLIQICPHRPDENCECRKPKPKLILEGIAQLNLDPKQSFMIGDRVSDFEAGQNAALRMSFLIKPGDEVSFKTAVSEILKISP